MQCQVPFFQLEAWPTNFTLSEWFYYLRPHITPGSWMLVGTLPGMLRASRRLPFLSRRQKRGSWERTAWCLRGWLGRYQDGQPDARSRQRWATEPPFREAEEISVSLQRACLAAPHTPWISDTAAKTPKRSRYGGARRRCQADGTAIKKARIFKMKDSCLFHIQYEFQTNEQWKITPPCTQLCGKTHQWPCENHWLLKIRN